ncbi:hypothetical protein DENSPDRAFT_66219 [Dentipellis sp. KUC8613]|nr:hypothetical protein DENSPDRAFT_66219 [Dentipellis sp. KUC8613]
MCLSRVSSRVNEHSHMSQAFFRSECARAVFIWRLSSLERPNTVPQHLYDSFPFFFVLLPLTAPLCTRCWGWLLCCASMVSPVSAAVAATSSTPWQSAADSYMMAASEGLVIFKSSASSLRGVDALLACSSRRSESDSALPALGDESWSTLRSECRLDRTSE